MKKIAILSLSLTLAAAPRHVFCKRHARQQAQHHDKCQCQCKLFFHIIPLLFNTINIILLDLAFIYILWETISIVCFLGAIILMDCILILKGSVL